MASGRTLVHALAGAVVALVLSGIPFSTLLGGAVAGFLEGSDARDGSIAGALAGLIVFLPFAGLGVLLLGLFGFALGVGTAPVEGFLVTLFLFGVAATIAFGYTVVLSLVGGYLGAYLAREYPGRRASTRETLRLDRSRASRADGPGVGTRPQTTEPPAERHDAAANRPHRVEDADWLDSAVDRSDADADRPEE